MCYFSVDFPTSENYGAGMFSCELNIYSRGDVEQGSVISPVNVGRNLGSPDEYVIINVLIPKHLT